jgi:hypothetical protein
LILVDTSIWIELLNGRLQSAISKDHLLEVRSCGPVLQEVLQGLREGFESSDFREAILAIPLLNDPLEQRTFLFAADIYRHGRRKGFTVRSSTDCLIAAIAIENDVTVWHRDRDFETISRYTTLRSTQRI